MTDYSDPAGRRRFLKLVGGSVVFVPLAGLSGCGGGDSSGPADSGSKPAAAGSGQSGAAAAGASPEPAPAKAAADSGGDGAPRVSLDDPQAKALGYVHDAANVDQSKYARYQAGQACNNCALFQGTGNEEWARCSIFPGKLVHSSGWCSAYAPKG
ncbi:MAG: high-potential iron-sulfur protein [Gammaproteobacteria bacterium]|jgi:hypothetical protein